MLEGVKYHSEYLKYSKNNEGNLMCRVNITFLLKHLFIKGAST